MNEERENELLRAATKKRFGRKRYLKCRGRIAFPDSVEREYIRLEGRILRPLMKAVKTYLPELKVPPDGTQEQTEYLTPEAMREIEETFRKISRKYAREVLQIDLRKALAKEAGHANKLSVDEWKKAIKSTLGIDILRDYYDGAFYEGMIERWVDENTGLISTIPQTALSKMEQIVKDGFLSGRTTREMTEQIMQEYHTSRSHARLLARDQTAKLNAQLTQKQHRDAGISLYEWSDSGDSRVRDSHKALSGRTFSYDDPPIVDMKTGRRCNPGEDYQCRCVAYPVFDYETLNLPVRMEK